MLRMRPQDSLQDSLQDWPQDSLRYRRGHRQGLVWFGSRGCGDMVRSGTVPCQSTSTSLRHGKLTLDCKCDVQRPHQLVRPACFAASPTVS